VSCNDVAVGAAAAEAPFVIIKDAPTAPNAGKAMLRRFRFKARFACAMVEPFCRAGQSSILDRHTCPEAVGHIRSKCLRMCEGIQITNGLVSNKLVSTWDQPLPMSVLPAKAEHFGANTDVPLGHKRTCAVQQPMSATGPIVDIEPVFNKNCVA
jgi:hypothetical protein